MQVVLTSKNMASGKWNKAKISILDIGQIRKVLKWFGCPLNELLECFSNKEKLKYRRPSLKLEVNRLKFLSTHSLPSADNARAFKCVEGDRYSIQ
jgi:hypothetical protein